MIHEKHSDRPSTHLPVANDGVCGYEVRGAGCARSGPQCGTGPSRAISAIMSRVARGVFRFGEAEGARGAGTPPWHAHLTQPDYVKYHDWTGPCLAPMNLEQVPAGEARGAVQNEKNAERPPERNGETERPRTRGAGARTGGTVRTPEPLKPYPRRRRRRAARAGGR